MRITCVREIAATILLAALVIVLLGTVTAPTMADTNGTIKERIPDIQNRIADNYGHLQALYKHLHTHPELSLHEVQTAARLAQELRDAGFQVTANVGGHGLVAILKNGDGPTVLVRTDM